MLKHFVLFYFIQNIIIFTIGVVRDYENFKTSIKVGDFKTIFKATYLFLLFGVPAIIFEYIEDNW